jgi:hypothetical protein
MRTGRRPRLANIQTAEERALWKTIRANLSERRRQKRQKYNLRSNREADIYIPMIVRHAAGETNSSPSATDSKIIPFRKS